MSTAIKRSCEDFVELLASAAPAPGGGGAAALVGALGMALGNMVGSLTLGKPKYAEVQGDIAELKARADALQHELLALVAKDAEVFEPLASAYRLPTQTEEQKRHKAEVMEVCLKECAAVPLEIMERCCEAIELHAAFAVKGTALALSDVGCGVICCKAALLAASLNVTVNTKLIADRCFAEELNERVLILTTDYGARADALYAEVAGRFA